MRMARRLLVPILAASALLAPAAAGAGVRVEAVDTSGYPQISVTVVTGTPSALSAAAVASV